METSIPNNNKTFLLKSLTPVRAAFLGSALMTFLGASIEAFQSYFMKLLLDTVEKYASQPEMLTQQMIFLLILFICLRVSTSIIWYVQGCAWAWASPRLRAQIRENLFAYVQQHPIAYFQNNFSGRIAHKVITASSAAVEIVEALLSDFLYTVTIGLTIFIIFITIHPALVMWFSLWLFVYVF